MWVQWACESFTCEVKSVSGTFKLVFQIQGSCRNKLAILVSNGDILVSYEHILVPTLLAALPLIWSSLLDQMAIFWDHSCSYFDLNDRICSFWNIWPHWLHWKRSNVSGKERGFGGGCWAVRITRLCTDPRLFPFANQPRSPLQMQKATCQPGGNDDSIQSEVPKSRITRVC